MSNRIAKLLLFVSTASKSSIDCVQFLQQNRIPNVSIVRLDTEEAREQAANGPMFQITVVPSLVVLYEDQNLQIFVGLQKIISWFQKAMAPVNDHPNNAHRQPPAKARSSNIYDTDPSEMQEREPMPHGIGPLPIPRGIAKQRHRQPVDTGYRAPIIDEGEDMEYWDENQYEEEEPVPVFVEEEDEDEVIIEEPKKRAPKKSSKKSSKSSSKASSKAATKINPKLKEAKEKLNRAAASKTKPPADKMKSVYAQAQKMQQDMSNSLGYKEEDLPHY
ncbi:MAG TPA: hypothetical protein PKD85_01430 [Saprospiraceae bacterium]|nr:hypothetical protein [Saprospiraceae bacterium]